MTDFFTTLEKIKQSPGMYLGCPSVSDLFMFIVGYDFARTKFGQALSEAEDHFYENLGYKKS